MVADRYADLGMHHNRFGIPLHKQYTLRIIRKLEKYWLHFKWRITE
jgi:hypothetical protein